MNVTVHLKTQSQPIEHTDVINTYQKGDFYILYTKGEKSFKYPIADIFRVIEDYGFHGRSCKERLQVYFSGDE